MREGLQDGSLTRKQPVGRVRGPDLQPLDEPQPAEESAALGADDQRLQELVDAPEALGPAVSRRLPSA